MTENKRQLRMTPRGITFGSLLRLLLATKHSHDLLKNGQTYFGITHIATAIWEEFYYEYTYDDFVVFFKNDFRDIFDDDELEALE